MSYIILYRYHYNLKNKKLLLCFAEFFVKKKHFFLFMRIIHKNYKNSNKFFQLNTTIFR